ncbi:hypothetical protein Bbelb_159030 [Branchiostoma belcheri]|nr:hypothetical protein Bbelb_159030 [Branchiostoma belcheri]
MKPKIQVNPARRRWDSQTPHYHTQSVSNDGNFCRTNKYNPCPWCYTVDPDLRYDYCFDCSPYKNEYRGTVNTTLTGKTCQMWASQKPHHSLYNTPYRLPQAGLKKNFCRTPDADRCPWCYTMDPKTRWEYCFVCGEY